MDNRKIIVASYVCSAFVLWFLTRQSLAALYTGVYAIRRIPNIQAIREALPVVVGIVSFLVAYFNARLGTFLDEVVSELKKVVWPGREDVVKSTVVVLGCVLFASCVLAFFDIAFGKAITFLIHTKF